MQVLRKEIFSTTPSTPLAKIQSPILKGLSNTMIKLPKTLARASLGKGYGNGAYTEGCNKATNIVIPFSGNGNKAEDNDNKTQNCGEDIGKGILGANTCFFQNIQHDAVSGVADVVAAPKEAKHQGAADDSVQKG